MSYEALNPEEAWRRLRAGSHEAQGISIPTVASEVKTVDGAVRHALGSQGDGARGAAAAGRIAGEDVVCDNHRVGGLIMIHEKTCTPGTAARCVVFKEVSRKNHGALGVEFHADAKIRVHAGAARDVAADRVA